MNLFHKNPRLFRLMVVAAICLFALPGLGVLATQTSDQPMIRLQYASFDPLFSEPAVPAGQQLQGESGAASLSILQFSGPVQEEWKAAVEATGARLYGYIPDYAFLARLDATTAETARGLPFVRWIGPYHPAYRLSDSMRAGPESQASGPVELSVEALPDTDLGVLASQVQALGGSVSDQFADEMMAYLRVTIDASQVQSLAALDGVVWVERYLQPQLFNDKGGEVMAVPAARSRQGLYGSGQVVAVADTGLDVGTTGAAMSDDFEGRILSGQAICGTMGYRTTWSDFHGHGTHVSGSILGNGKLSGSNPATHTYNSSFAGAAPEAQLVFQSIDDPTNPYLECIPSNLKDFLFKQAYDAGARIHSNSWGGPTGDNSNPYGGYDIQAQSADNAAWYYKDMLVLYAAGNSGTDADGNGVVDSDSLGSPGTAKNVLTVGATENNRPTFVDTWGSSWPSDYTSDPIASDRMSNNTQGMAAFSSRGPADDGRIKPDIVAPGTFILSARSHDPLVSDFNYWEPYNADYAYMGGTSMATPLTAGAAALVREWLVEKRGFDHPSAALLKAALLNGAANISPGQYGTGGTREIPATVPNSVTGWGRADLVGALSPNPPRQIWLQDTTTGLSTGGQASYTIRVGGATSQAAQEVDTALVNTESPEQVEATPAPPVQAAVIEVPASLPATPEPPGKNPARHNVEPGVPLLDGMVSSPAAPGAAAGVNDLIVNGGFESDTSWVTDQTARTNAVAYSGSWSMASTAAVDGSFYQTVDFPADAISGTLHTIFRNDPPDFIGDSCYDVFSVEVWDESFSNMLGASPSAYCNSDTDWWSLDLYFDLILDNLKGKTVNIVYNINQDGTTPDAVFYFDDISLDVNTPGGATPTATPTRTASPTPTTSGTPPTPTPTPVTGGPMRITLAWSDYPGIPAAAKALVNDLDLEVIAPNETHYYGNSGLYTSGQCFRSPHWDACNNVEGVLVPNAAYGNYTIIVHGYNVANGPQPFAVVASGDNLLLGDKRVFLPMLRK